MHCDTLVELYVHQVGLDAVRPAGPGMDGDKELWVGPKQVEECKRVKLCALVVFQVALPALVIAPPLRQQNTHCQ
jgi:hypothetical protein